MSISPRAALPTLAALAVIVAAYSNVAGGTFIWDDRPLIVDEPAVHQVTPLRYFAQPFWQASPFTEGHDVYYRPLTTWTYAVDWARGRGSAGPFHIVNLLLHLAVCALVALLAMMRGANPLAAGLAAAVFGSLPRLTESVSWISGRTDVLATLFALSALSLHLSNPDRSARRAVAAVLVLLGLFSKEVALAAALGIIAFEIARNDSGRWAVVLSRSAPVLLAVVAYVTVRLAALRSLPGDAQLAGPGLANRLVMSLQASGHYVLMILDPFRPRLQIGVWGEPEPAVIATGAVAITLVALLTRRNWRRTAPDGWGLLVCAAAAIGLVLHLVPIRLGVVSADRFLYLPLAALTVVAAVRATRLSPRLQVVAAMAALTALPALAFATFQRSAQWNGEITLWERAVHTTPETNPLPVHEYASALARAGRLPEAIVQYQRAADLSTGRRRISALVDVATTLSDSGELDAGVERMRAAMGLGKPLPSYHYNLAILEARRLHFDIAEAELQRAIALLPSYTAAREALLWVNSARERWRALPPGAESEAVDVTARRAVFFADLGVPTEAGRLWRVVGNNPRASPDDLLAAAVFHLRRDEQVEATNALDSAAARGGDATRIAALRAVLGSGTFSR